MDAKQLINSCTESNVKPLTRTLQFYVMDEPGALANALIPFRVSDCYVKVRFIV